MKKSYVILGWITGVLVASLTVAAVVWLWTVFNADEEPVAADEGHTRAGLFYHCGQSDALYGESYKPGRSVSMPLAGEGVELRLDFLGGNGAEVSGPAFVRVSRDGEVTQLVDLGDARAVSICDLNGDGLPDLMLDLGMGARVVNTQAYLYAPDHRRFVPLEYDGDLVQLKRLFALIDWDLSADGTLDSAERQATDKLVFVKQSLWSNDGGITTCWVMRGHRLVFVAALRRAPGRTLRAFWDVTSNSDGGHARVVDLSRHTWSLEENGYGGDLDCPELVAGLGALRGRTVGLGSAHEVGQRLRR